MFWQRKSTITRKPMNNKARRRTLQLEALETRATPAVFMVTNVNDSGDGSLRAAITSSNSTVGQDSVQFNISGGASSVSPITLQSSLPTITDSVFLNSSYQSIEITAGATNIPWGLTLKCSNSEVYGLTINGFQAGSMLVDGGTNNLIQSCILGADSVGTSVPRHGQVASLAFINGASKNTATQSVIAGSKNGVLIDGVGTIGNAVSSSTIGGRGGVGLGNGTGVLISGGATGNVVGDRYDSLFSPNSILGNTGSGIKVIGTTTAANRLFGNLNYGNGGLPIDLGGDGVTKNDYLDADVGPNQFANTPVVQTIVDRGTSIIVQGVLDSIPNQSFDILGFASPSPSVNGRGEARQIVGGVTVKSDGSGHAVWSMQVDNRNLSQQKLLDGGWVVSAVATNQYNNTSEFSAAFSFTNGGPNQPPVIGQGNTPVSYVAGALPVLVAPAGGVIDRDTPNYGGGYLSVKTIANAVATDRLGIRSTGTGAGQISTSGNLVQYGGVTIGTFSGGAGSNALVIALNKNATPAAAQSLLRAITFESLSGTPSTAKRTLQFQLGDGHGQLSNNAFSFVNVM